jgi:cytochrome c oxidase subunit 2
VFPGAADPGNASIAGLAWTDNGRERIGNGYGRHRRGGVRDGAPPDRRFGLALPRVRRRLVPTTPASIADTTDEFSSLFDLYLIVTVAGGAVTTLAILVAVLWFRARPGRTPSRRGPPRILYVLWIGILAAAVVTLTMASLRTEAKVDPLSNDPDLRVRVIASQWKWTFYYPGGVVSRELVVPVGSTVEFTLRARDVIHALWIPELRFKRYAFPDRETRFDLTFEREGTYTGVCSQFCGFDHTGMVFTTRVASAQAFESWLASGGTTA